MNNCPKCGNPLEPGVTSCPICGNDLSNPNPQDPNNVVQNDNINSSVPVAPTTETSVANSNQSVSVETTPVVANPIEQPAPQVAEVVPESAPVEPSQSQVVPVEQAPAAPIEQVPAVPTEQVVVTPTTPTESVPVQTEPTPIAPTPTPIAPSPTPVATAPVVPTPTITDSPPTPVVNNQPPEKKQKPKGKNNSALIVVFLIVVISGIGIFMKMGNGTKTPTTPNNLAVETTSVTSNGYKFNLPKTWLLAEDSENVVINNEDNTVSIKLDHSESTITNINEEMIKKVVSTHDEYTDTEVSKIKISAKDAYLVNTTINKMPVQIYFINGGSNLLIGVTIVYQSNDSKTKYEASVTQMIGTLSFADESIKALDTINMYSNIFNTYNSIINYHEPPVEETTPSEENIDSEENVENNNNEENSSNN